MQILPRFQGNKIFKKNVNKVPPGFEKTLQWRAGVILQQP